MAVTFELLEDFTGSRDYSAPDSNTGEMVTYTENTINVLVRFLDDETGRTWNKHINVIFDEAGNYDAAATNAKFTEIANES